MNTVTVTNMLTAQAPVGHYCTTSSNHNCKALYAAGRQPMCSMWLIALEVDNGSTPGRMVRKCSECRLQSTSDSV